MSQRNRGRRAAPGASVAAAAAGPAALSLPGHDVVRRGVLVLVTALVVAWPVVRGEDPGLVSDFSDAGGLGLTCLALVGCVGWAAWRLGARQPAVYAGPVEAALVLLTGVFFLTAAFRSPNQRAAWLTAWQWLGMALTVFLVRQFAVRPEEQQGLLAVLLAGAVALSAQGLYQAAIDLPEQARDAAKVEEGTYVKDQLRLYRLIATPSEVYALEQRLERRQAHGPYFHPSSLAGCLALLLPGLAAAALAARRAPAPGWLRAGAAGCALLAGLVLCLTRCWSAVAAVVLVGMVAAGLAWPARRGGARVGVAVALGLAALAGGALWEAGLFAPEWDRCREAWPAAWQMIGARGWLGVGPAQFRFFYPRYMAETAGPQRAEPGNLVLQLWAEVGVAGLLAFAAVLCLFFWLVGRWLLQHGETGPSQAPPPPSEVVPDGEVPVRWEYYAGGMLGMVLAFLLRVGALHADEALVEGVGAAVRSVAWFAGLAVLERIACPAAWRVKALAAGAVALLLVLLVNDGVGYTSVVGVLWVAVALVLCVVTPRPAPWLSGRQVAFTLPLPVLLAVTFVFFAFVLYPAAASAGVDRQARVRGEVFFTQRNKAPQERTLRDPAAFITDRIIAPLKTASDEDPGNVRLHVLLANWYGELAQLAPAAQKQTPDVTRAMAWASLARQANREGPAGYEVEYDVLTRLARTFAAAAASRQEQLKDPKLKIPVLRRREAERMVAALVIASQNHYAQAYRGLRPYLPRDPTSPYLHFHLAFALDKAKQFKESREMAREARRLDHRVAPPRKLTDRQQAQLDAWLGPESPR
jgi:hypothetical protein